MNTLFEFFKFFSLVFGSFVTLYCILRLTQRGEVNFFAALASTAFLSWGLYSLFGHNL